ncbi:MAG: hypothetical protein M1826_000038 [Phylliscum demangeonii]|nr:MAG: hypothetical protein M1826_000038 [Phylliscum demangeonii]
MALPSTLFLLLLLCSSSSLLLLPLSRASAPPAPPPPPAPPQKPHLVPGGKDPRKHPSTTPGHSSAPAPAPTPAPAPARARAPARAPASARAFQGHGHIHVLEWRGRGPAAGFKPAGYLSHSGAWVSGAGASAPEIGVFEGQPLTTTTTGGRGGGRRRVVGLRSVRDGPCAVERDPQPPVLSCGVGHVLSSIPVTGDRVDETVWAVFSPAEALVLRARERKELERFHLQQSGNNVPDPRGDVYFARNEFTDHQLRLKWVGI